MKPKTLAIHGGELLTPWEHFSPGMVIIEQGKIAFAGPQDKSRIPSGAELLEAEGKIITAGLVDVHIHGGAGADFSRDGEEGLKKMAGFLLRHGVTSFLPTTPSAPLQQLEEAVKVARDAAAQPPSGAQVLGLHLEGPYLSPARKGAHDEKHLCKPNFQECRNLVELGRGAVKMVTLAPELEGALELIQFLRGQNITVSLGHSEATYEETKEAIEAGANHGCHLFNAMPDMKRREPGIAGALLEDERVYTEFIADLVHVHPLILRMVFLTKGARRSLLISDAMEAAGMPEGTYALSGQKVEVREGAARLENGTLAGSTLTLDRAVKNAVEVLQIPREAAFAMASQTAADSLGLTNKGRLQAGADGDLTLFNPDLTVSATIVGGEVLFQEETGT